MCLSQLFQWFVCYRRQNPPADTWNVNWVKKSIVPKLTVVTVTPPLSAPAWKLQIFRWMHGLLGYSDICVLLIKTQMNPEEISADLWRTTDADLASSLCCWFCWKPECCSEGSKTWHKVQFQHPNRSSSELRPDKLFQDQSTLWFCLQTRLSTRGHCVSVSGLTHLHEGAVSSLFSSIVKKKNHKSEISWQKNVYSLKKIHLIFFHSCFFLTRIFFTWFWIENIFFLMKIQFRRQSILRHVRENLLHFVFKRKLFFLHEKQKFTWFRTQNFFFWLCF